MCGVQNAANPNRPNWDLWAPRLIYGLIAFFGAAFAVFMVLIGYLSPIVKTEMALDLGDASAAVAVIVACIALAMQVRLTTTTNNITTHIRNDQTRRDKLDVLLKAHRDTIQLFNCINAARLELERQDTDHIAAAAAYDRTLAAFFEARNGLLSNKLSLTLSFDESVELLISAIDHAGDVAREIISSGFRNPKREADGSVLFDETNNIEDQIKALWKATSNGIPL